MRNPTLNLLVYIFLLISCNNTTNEQLQNDNSNTGTKADSVIISDSMDIAEDKLNNAKFSVAVLETDSSVSGSYTIAIVWGHNRAKTILRMPYNCEYSKLSIRTANKPFSYIIGFYLKGDSTFYDYYQVLANKGQIRAGYIKSYTFD